MGSLSEVQIRNWIKAGLPVAKSDGGGLTFTLSRKRTATWVLRYRFGSKARELTLGRYRDISLAKARELATQARAQIQQGADVARNKQIASIERVAAKSLRQLASNYMEMVFPTLAENTVKQRRYHIEKIIVPRLGSLAAREVSTADIVALIETVGQRSKSVAELVFTALSEMFKHGIARHSVIANPCAGISVTAICGKRVPSRERLKLTAAELRLILPSLTTIGKQNALAVKILLATCVRIGELTQARWSDLDFDRGEWTISDAASKTGKGFTVPLCLPIVGWFRELKTFSGRSSFVLPARQMRRMASHGGDAHFEPRALNAMLSKLCAKLDGKVRRFTPHDLRSTARSHLAALGVPLIVAERCLNHSLGGLVAVYDRHDYMMERRVALELWANFLAACETGEERKPMDEKVISLRSQAA